MVTDWPAWDSVTLLPPARNSVPLEIRDGAPATLPIMLTLLPPAPPPPGPVGPVGPGGPWGPGTPMITLLGMATSVRHDAGLDDGSRHRAGTTVQGDAYERGRH